ncbi:hypothetical protein EVAR_7556_1 [Eumeta japonica]|uniref:Uncharacterized protein n=1 Tax=Eumeta variegata TaxID=151549 RepID=A0A4C1VQC9_EUMVA|nr:hypothetical protein EVAR_7556_1 [Eumeta japonica]
MRTSSRRVDLAVVKLQRALDLLRLAGQMACCVTKNVKCYEEGRPIDRPTAYHATEAEIPGTGGGMADQGVIPGRTDRPLYAYGRSGGTCHPSEQSRAEHAAPSSPIAPTAPSQSRHV